MLDNGIAPQTGYSSDAKKEYRLSVWRDLSARHIAGTWAVLMPARGCDEIDVALSCGIPEQDILCFDASSAVIATSLWRKKYPNIKFFTSTLGNLPSKIAKTGKKVSVINMDLCGNVSGSAPDEISDFMKGRILTNRGAFSINIAKGREGKMLLRAISMMRVDSSKFDCDRMAALFFIADIIGDRWYAYSILRQGQYRENKTPMTWATFQFEPKYQHCGDPDHVDRVRKAIDEKDKETFWDLVKSVYRDQIEMEKRIIGYDAGKENVIYANVMATSAPLDPKDFRE